MIINAARAVARMAAHCIKLLQCAVGRHERLIMQKICYVDGGLYSIQCETRCMRCGRTISHSIPTSGAINGRH